MKSYRLERVANVIRTVVSDAIATKLGDPRIEPMTSVTRVDVSGDLEYAKVWVSVMGEPAGQRRTIEGLNSARGCVQGLLARQLPTRQCPRIMFHLDESIKRAVETIRMIDEAMSELEADAGELPDQQGADE